MKQIRRRRYLVRKNVQFRYMWLVVVPLVVLLSALYYLIYYSVFNEILIPEALVNTLLPAMRKVNIVLVVAVPLLLVFLIKIIFMQSNRTIGPIPRLEKELDKVISGDYSVRIKTRKKDDLKCFVDKINVLLERLDAERNT